MRQPDDQTDPQSGWRIGLLATFKNLVPEGQKQFAYEQTQTDDELRELDARYCERVPAAKAYRRMHGFSYWRAANIARVRYIAGFGRITWLPGDCVERDPKGSGLAEAAPSALEHMNEDHHENLLEMCRGFCGISPESARLVDIDRTGFLVETHSPNELVHFSFGREIDASDLRKVAVELTHRARALSDAKV